MGEGLDLPIVTQGKTIDEVANNLREALAVHLEGENLEELGLAPQLSALVNFEIEPTYA